MKTYFSIILCLFLSISSFAQVELKGFITGSILNNNTAFSFPSSTQESSGVSFSPSVAIAFNKGNQFHELQLLNVSFINYDFTFNNPANQTQNQKTRSFGIRYSYNFYFLENVERWSPFLGLQTTQSIFYSKATTLPSNTIGRTVAFTNFQGVVPGIQYRLNNKLKLEFAVPTNLTMLMYSQDNISSRFDWETSVPNRFQVRLGCSVIL
ncbi:MAG: hypothetical protein AB8G11_22970 [Saprospiraceae bacterium]